jgi:hypothetical protein
LVGLAIVQSVQGTPRIPQRLAAWTWQALFWQQPSKQEFGVHVQPCPGTHSCPSSQMSPPSHWHTPPLHWLALPVGQGLQVPPAEPQAAGSFL